MIIYFLYLTRCCRDSRSIGVHANINASESFQTMQMPSTLQPEAEKVILCLTDYFRPHEIAFWFGLQLETVHQIQRRKLSAH
jgi:hypothetical protein